MAYTDFHVNGPAILCIAKSGNTPVRFGVTDRGVSVSFNAGISPVMADDEGEYMPADLQYMGITASITGRLTRWDKSIVEILRARLPDRSAGAIADADIGTLLFASGQTFELYIESAARTGLPVEPPHRFARVVPTEVFNQNLGTKYSEQPFGFTAYRKDGVLYTRV